MNDVTEMKSRAEIAARTRVNQALHKLNIITGQAKLVYNDERVTDNNVRHRARMIETDATEVKALLQEVLIDLRHV